MSRWIRYALTSFVASPLLALAAGESETHRDVQLADTRLALIAPRSGASADAVPIDAELERRGARIGHIDIQVDDVFEKTQPLAAPYRLANGLHMSTRAATVTQQLLFRCGERYNRRLLEETARLLRSQRYLNDAWIEPVRYNDDNTVDVLVRVHDVWTLSPGFSFGRKGGENDTRLKFEDTNFLGLGKQISLARTSDVDRTAWSVAYLDPNVLGSWWRLSTAYASLSDGAQSEITLARPFYSLDARWSASVGAADTTSSISRYSLGQRVERFDMQQRQFQAGGGFSAGLNNGWAWRYLGGLHYDARLFTPYAGDPDATIPPDRTLAYPWVGLEVVEEQYVRTRNLDQIGRTEDLYLGRSARIEAGFSFEAFGSTRDALILNGALQAGMDLGRERYLVNTAGFTTRVQHAELANALLDLSSRYYVRQSPRRVFFGSMTASLASNLDPEQQLLLGGDNGLRGYPLRYQAGTARALITLEERFYTRWQPLKLFDVGAAVFFDAGRTWGHDDFAAPPAGWLKDVGVGLRLGSARSGLGNVLHVDLAFPLDRASNDIDTVQLLIETRRSF
jgi:Omp85 superfamily domain